MEVSTNHLVTICGWSPSLWTNWACCLMGYWVKLLNFLAERSYKISRKRLNYAKPESHIWDLFQREKQGLWEKIGSTRSCHPPSLPQAPTKLSNSWQLSWEQQAIRLLQNLEPRIWKPGLAPISGPQRGPKTFPSPHWMGQHMPFGN
jgi:hypothetical protein